MNVVPSTVDATEALARWTTAAAGTGAASEVMTKTSLAGIGLGFLRPAATSPSAARSLQAIDDALLGVRSARQAVVLEDGDPLLDRFAAAESSLTAYDEAIRGVQARVTDRVILPRFRDAARSSVNELNVQTGSRLRALEHEGLAGNVNEVVAHVRQQLETTFTARFHDLDAVDRSVDRAVGQLVARG